MLEYKVTIRLAPFESIPISNSLDLSLGITHRGVLHGLIDACGQNTIFVTNVIIREISGRDWLSPEFEQRVF